MPVTELEAMLTNVFTEVVNSVKTSRPVAGGGDALARGYVFSLMPEGDLVDPIDYMYPTTLAGTPGRPDPNTPGATRPPTPQEQLASENAALNTQLLVAEQVRITADGRYETYTPGRSLNASWDGIVAGAEPAAGSSPSPGEQTKIDAALNTLFDPKSGEDTPQYARYIAAQESLASANMAVATAQVAGTAQSVRQDAQAKLKRARDALLPLRAVDEALLFLRTRGVAAQERMIDAAKSAWATQGLMLGGQEYKYGFLTPSSWADPQAKDTGWTSLRLAKKSYNSYSNANTQHLETAAWNSSSSNSSGSGGISIWSFGFSGEKSATRSGWESHQVSSGLDSFQWGEDATDLEIELEYGLIRCRRPQMLFDFLYTGGWALKGQPKETISNGKLDPPTQDAKLLPMLPTHWLVIRNVTLRTNQWKQAGQSINKYLDEADASGFYQSSSVGGGGFAVLGPFALGARGRRTAVTSGGDTRSYREASTQSGYGTAFEDNELRIMGSQICGALSVVMPPSAPVDAG
jgi:hypothetical protein